MSDTQPQQYVFYKGEEADFMVFIDNLDALQKYTDGDTSVPLSQIVSNFEVYRTISGKGSSGKLVVASDGEIAEEFGDFKDVDSDIIPRILKKGIVQNLMRKIFDHDMIKTTWTEGDKIKIWYLSSLIM